MKAHRITGDPTRLGTVEDVTGPTVRVKLADDTAHGLLFVKGEGYRVGQVGSFVRIPAGYCDLFGIVSQVGAGAAPVQADGTPQLGTRWLRIELVGEGRSNAGFERGISQYPSIGDQVHVVTESDLRAVYAPGDEDAYIAIGRVASAESIRAYVNINKLVSRHCAVVGSTGAGKSTAVTSLLAAISDTARFPSARVVLLDLHGEYASAFGKKANVFRISTESGKAGSSTLHVPFWALTFDELVAMTFGLVGPAQLAVIQESILTMKRSSRPKGAPHTLASTDVSVDTPLPFCLHKLWHDLHSLYYATHSVGPNQNQNETTREYEMAADGVTPLKGDVMNVERPRFKPIVASSIYKSSAGDQRSHIDVLESKLRDPRLSFLYRPGKWTVAEDGSTEADLDSLLDAWMGTDHPISVFDLSGIPVAILDHLVGALLRILYDASFWGRNLPVGGRTRPLLIVLEEAHTYLGSQGKKAAEAARRIAKEGRKYGVGLMLVSQRPSEIDSTILAQCGTLVSLRLTNESDRSQIRSCASDNLEGLFSMLPILRTGEALVVGEGVSMPVRALIDLPGEGERPDSEDPEVVVRRGKDNKRVRPGGWTEPATDEKYDELVDAWRRQNGSAPLPGSKASTRGGTASNN